MRKWLITLVLVLVVVVPVASCKSGATTPSTTATVTTSKASTSTSIPIPTQTSSSTAIPTSSQTSTVAQVPTEIPFGLGIPLTGAAASVGVVVQRTFEMVAADIGVFQVAGKPYKWKLIPSDNLYTTAGGVSSTTKFIQQDKASFVYQIGSAPAMGAIPVIDAAGNVIANMASSEMSILGPSHPYVFRDYTSSYDVLPGGLSWLVPHFPEIKTAYIVVTDDATGTAVDEAYRANFAYYGVKVLGTEFYPRTTTDFYPVMTKVQAAKPDVIVVVSSSTAGVVVKQARDLGYTGKFIESTGVSGNEVATAGGAKNAEGIFAWDPDGVSDMTPKALRDFVASYTAKFNGAPSSFFRVVYPTLYILTGAVQKAGTVNDIKKIAQVMETQSFDTPIGSLKYGSAALYGVPHQLVMPVYIGEITGGQYRNLAVVDSATAASLAEKVYAKK